MRGPGIWRWGESLAPLQSALAEGYVLAIPTESSYGLAVDPRSREGVEFEAMDGRPIHIFLGMVTPSYDDGQYFKLVTWLAARFREEEWLKDALLDATNEGEIIRIFQGLR